MTNGNTCVQFMSHLAFNFSSIILNYTRVPGTVKNIYQTPKIKKKINKYQFFLFNLLYTCTTVCAHTGTRARVYTRYCSTYHTHILYTTFLTFVFYTYVPSILLGLIILCSVVFFLFCLHHLLSIIKMRSPLYKPNAPPISTFGRPFLLVVLSLFF
jgi:hypothetical protein